MFLTWCLTNALSKWYCNNDQSTLKVHRSLAHILFCWMIVLWSIEEIGSCFSLYREIKMILSFKLFLLQHPPLMNFSSLDGSFLFSLKALEMFYKPVFWLARLWVYMMCQCISYARLRCVLQRSPQIMCVCQIYFSM